MEKYYFNELSELSKKRAVKDYIKAWNIIHIKDELPNSEVVDILQNDYENEFMDNGQFLGEY